MEFNLTKNIFEEIGCNNPQDMLKKAEIMLEISQKIEAKNLTLKKASKLIGISQKHLNNLLKGKFRNIEESKLKKYLDVIIL